MNAVTLRFMAVIDNKDNTPIGFQQGNKGNHPQLAAGEDLPTYAFKIDAR
jgi:hypothetical protein